MQLPIEQWTRECQQSLQRSHAKRESPHPFPRSNEWRAFLATIGIFATLFALYILLWAIQ